jgi:hypothetical protein
LSDGIVMCATGRKFLDEARVAVRQIRRVYPDMPICVFTDDPDAAADLGGAEIAVIAQPRYGNSDKFYALLNTPFQHTLYLDTDVHVRGGLEELFELLARFDVLACYDAARFQYPDYELAIGTAAEPQLNGGVLGLRDARRFAAAWQDEYDRFVAWLEQHVPADARLYWDQVALRAAVLRSGLRLHILPPEYNMRPNQIVALPPKIVHNRAFVRLPERKKDAVLGQLDTAEVRGARGFHARLLLWRGRGTVARALWSLVRRGYVAIRL